MLSKKNLAFIGILMLLLSFQVSSSSILLRIHTNRDTNKDLHSYLKSLRGKLFDEYMSQGTQYRQINQNDIRKFIRYEIRRG